MAILKDLLQNIKVDDIIKENAAGVSIGTLSPRFVFHQQLTNELKLLLV